MTTLRIPLMIPAAVILVTLLGAALAAGGTAPAPVKAPDVTTPEGRVGGVTVTLDELKTLLDRKETPRLSVTNKFGGTAAGRATSIEKGKLLLDVSAEDVGIDGVLGIALGDIVSIKVLIPLTQEETEAARKASSDYLAALRRQMGAEAAAAGGLQSTDSLLMPGEALESTDSGLKSPPRVASTDSALAGPEEEQPVDPLETYPPAEGWGPKRLAEIVRKAVVLHLEPAGKEKTFLKDYDAWKTAYEKKRNQQLEEEAALKSMNKPIPDGFSVLPELEPVPGLEGAPSPAGNQPVGNDTDGQPVGAPSQPSDK